MERCTWTQKLKTLGKPCNNISHRIEFLSETNDGLVMTNRKLREDLEDINAHYQELIVVSKEALKRKRQIQNQAEDLAQQVQKLSKQNEILLNRVGSLEMEQKRSKK